LSRSHTPGRFGQDAQTTCHQTDDEFEDSELGEWWNLVREDEDHWALSQGSLVVALQSGDLRGAGNDARNILLQDANTDWTIESMLQLPDGPLTRMMQCGLIAYQDDDNYVTLIFKTTSSFQFGPTGFSMGYDASVQLAYEVEGAEYTIARVDVGDLLKEDRQVELKLEKKGSSYAGSCSIGGNDLELNESVHSVLSDIRAGLLTCEGQAPRSYLPFRTDRPRTEPEGIEIRYDYFRISSSGMQ